MRPRISRSELQRRLRARTDERAVDEDLVARLAVAARTAPRPAVARPRRRFAAPAAALVGACLVGGVGVSYAAGIVEPQDLPLVPGHERKAKPSPTTPSPSQPTEVTPSPAEPTTGASTPAPPGGPQGGGAGSDHANVPENGRGNANGHGNDRGNDRGNGRGHDKFEDRHPGKPDGNGNGRGDGRGNDRSNDRTSSDHGQRVGQAADRSQPRNPNATSGDRDRSDEDGL